MMNELVVSILAGIITVPCVLLILKLMDQFQSKKDRKERLYFCQKSLHALAIQFQNECMDETKKVIAQYTNKVSWKGYRGDAYMVFDFLHDYQKAIDAIKKDYFANYALKYSKGDNQLRIEAEDLPSYLLDEYSMQISEIKATFDEIGRCMYQQIEELRERDKANF